MAIVENWIPPSRENWELIVYLFQFFPLVLSSDCPSSTLADMASDHCLPVDSAMVCRGQDVN